MRWPRPTEPFSPSLIHVTEIDLIDLSHVRVVWSAAVTAAAFEPGWFSSTKGDDILDGDDVSQADTNVLVVEFGDDVTGPDAQTVSLSAAPTGVATFTNFLVT